MIMGNREGTIPFKKIIGEIRKYFNDIGITVKGYIYTRLRLRLLIIS